MNMKVQEELKRLEKEKIIHLLKSPTDWCSLIGAIPQRDGRTRLCVDYTQLNESVKQEKLPLPSSDQFLAEP